MWKLIFLAVTFAAVHAELLTEDADGNVHVLQKSTHKQKLLTQKVKNLETHENPIYSEDINFSTLNVNGNLNVVAGLTVQKVALDTIINNMITNQLQQRDDINDQLQQLLQTVDNSDETVLDRLIALLQCTSCNPPTSADHVRCKHHNIAIPLPSDDVIEVGFGSILTELVHQKRYNEQNEDNEHTFVLGDFAITGIDVNGVSITDIPSSGMIVDGNLKVYSQDAHGFIIIDQHLPDSFLIHTHIVFDSVVNTDDWVAVKFRVTAPNDSQCDGSIRFRICDNTPTDGYMGPDLSLIHI